MVLFDIMGFGRPLDQVPMILQPGVITMAWGSVIRLLAAGLGVELDEIVSGMNACRPPRTSRWTPAPWRRGRWGRCISNYAACGGDRAVIVLEHVTRLHDDLGHDGRSRPERAATVLRSRESPTTRSTSS